MLTQSIILLMCITHTVQQEPERITQHQQKISTLQNTLVEKQKRIVSKPSANSCELFQPYSNRGIGALTNPEPSVVLPRD